MKVRGSIKGAPGVREVSERPPFVFRLMVYGALALLFMIPMEALASERPDFWNNKTWELWVLGFLGACISILSAPPIYRAFRGSIPQGYETFKPSVHNSYWRPR